MIDVLLPEPVEALHARDREVRLQKAFAETAGELSVDERYVLRRLIALAAQQPDFAEGFLGVFLSLPVAEFALHAGLTPKVAHRRLDIATHAIFQRSTTLVSDEGMTSVFTWATSRGVGEESLDLTFNSTFVKSLCPRLGANGERFDPTLVQTPASQEGGGLFAFAIEINSRRKDRPSRPKVMPFTRMLARVMKHVKSGLTRDEQWDLEDAVYNASPWQGLTEPRYYKYTHKDLRALHAWVIEYMDKHGFPAE